jgi:lytic murein transglycosylase
MVTDTHHGDYAVVRQIGSDRIRLDKVLARGAMVVAVAFALMSTATMAHADAAFDAFLEGVWPEAKEAGVSRHVFDSAVQGLTPDFSLPDLILPGRETVPERGQAEFTQPAQAYVNPTTLSNLAAQGRALLAQHKPTLERIEREIGVDRYGLLAIWGRETAFGTYKLPHDAMRVLATQAYVGRRKELFRTEFVAGLKMLAAGVPRADMKASWAGAVGLTQFMPTEFFKNGVDFDGNGRIDLVHSIPDALASAAKQLKEKGWVLGQPWGYEVVLPPTSSCALEGPPGSRTVTEWMALGFKRPGGKLFRPADLEAQAYLMSPAGAYGPSFLALENFQVIRRYNTSDLYALFVGNLADRIAGGGNFEIPWATVPQPATKLVASVQTRLKALGYPMDKIDGKIGSNTRRQIGIFETDHALKVDCWPSQAVLTTAIGLPLPTTAAQ